MTGGATVRVSNIPLTIIAADLFSFFAASVGSVYAVDIVTARRNWKSRGYGRVQFDSSTSADAACALAASSRLPALHGARLDVLPSNDDIVVRAVDFRNRIEGSEVSVGILVSEGEMEVFESWERVRVEIMPERKRVDLYVGSGGKVYRLEVMFSDVGDWRRCSIDGGLSKGLLLQLKYAPRIFEQMLSMNLTNNRYRVVTEDFQFTWVRSPDFSKTRSIGKSCYLCVHLAEDFFTSDFVNDLPFNADLVELSLSRGKSLLPPSELVPLLSCPSEKIVEYEILFQLNSLVHMQKISCAHVGDDLFDVIRALESDTALRILAKMHKLKSTCYDPVQYIKTWISRTDGKNQNMSSSKNMSENNLMSIHRLLVTPTKAYCLGPEVETSNYVVKHFSAHASDFLRVSFVDEDWGKLPAFAVSTKFKRGVLSKPYRTAIYDRILSILKNGICIGSKKFEFLAFSASQLRSNSAWMFASNNVLTAHNIREWMGHFKNIHSVSKCAARMGQLFSSSLQTLSVPDHDVKIIPDVEITTEDGKTYCFSDGIGKISRSFADEVAKKCGLSYTPSAFQIRYGGYKGVIAVDRTSFRKLSLRNSMLKFKSASRMLNVTNWSGYQPCFLNREIICLLSTLGVKDEIFESLQRKQMALLNEMLTSREVALRVLDRMSGSEARTAVKMLMHGYEPKAEPYLSMILKAYWENQLSDIRSRCRIFVPKGRILVGCLDETATLDYGQIFVKITLKKDEIQDEDQAFFHKVNEKTAILIGNVVVTKNPCLHPGDIRVLQAVYDVTLDDTDLVDCILFPQKGSRPHPNECSGGDLDGDLYFISWDQNLIPPEMDAPMDYTAGRPRIMDHDITIEEMQTFFVNYMINDTLGIISNSHLVYADSEPDKARSDKCVKLASLHSMAVDFAKTGAPAEMPRALVPKEYPDFMERWDRKMYISTGVLGKLYRATLGDAERQNLVSFHFDMQSYRAYDFDLEVEGFQDFIGAAEDYYEQYANKLSALMNYYGAEYEDEILTGNLRKKSLYLQKDKKKYGEMKDRIQDGVRGLQKEVGRWFKYSCAASDSLKMASAWYHVTYHPSYHSETRFFSFPWILVDLLLTLKASNV